MTVSKVTTTKKVRVNAAAIIAGTIGFDAADIKDYRYQYRHTGKLAIYAVGQEYFTVSKTKPDWSGLKWEPCKDQFWAEQAGTTVWQAAAESGE